MPYHIVADFDVLVNCSWRIKICHGIRQPDGLFQSIVVIAQASPLLRLRVGAPAHPLQTDGRLSSNYLSF